MVEREPGNLPKRWKGRPEAPGLEGRASALFSAVQPAAEPSDAAYARIQARLNAEPQGWRNGWRVAQLALAVGLVMLTVQVGVAVVRRLTAQRREAPAAFLPAIKPVRLPPLRAPPSAPPPAPVAEPIPTPAPRSISRPAAPEGELAVESRELSVALHRLHQDHSPSGALEALNNYRRRFPQGVLSREADAAEIEADLALGRERAALSTLDRIAARGFDGVPRATELQVLRAEMLVRAGRRAEAHRLFDALGAQSLPAALRERVLYGRAGCLSKEGNTVGGRAALKAYLAEYPAGRFAAAAREALGPDAAP